MLQLGVKQHAAEACCDWTASNAHRVSTAINQAATACCCSMQQTTRCVAACQRKHPWPYLVDLDVGACGCLQLLDGCACLANQLAHEVLGDSNDL
jgi:hypothetical protein